MAAHEKDIREIVTRKVLEKLGDTAVKVFRWYLAIRYPVEEVLTETRWKIGLPNLRH